MATRTASGVLNHRWTGLLAWPLNSVSLLFVLVNAGLGDDADVHEIPGKSGHLLLLIVLQVNQLGLQLAVLSPPTPQKK